MTSTPLDTEAAPDVRDLDASAVLDAVVAARRTADAEEARLMLDEQVVAAPEDLDLAMITGAGFSFWNGGLTMLLDREGLGEKVSGKRFH